MAEFVRYVFRHWIVATSFAAGLIHVGLVAAQDGAQFSAEILTLTPQIESVISGGRWKRVLAGLDSSTHSKRSVPAVDPGEFGSRSAQHHRTDSQD